MRVYNSPEKGLIKSWAEEIESAALDQLTTCSNLPFIYKWISAMPDVHAGIGATVGYVIPTKGAIILRCLY